ncbi:MAG TPA: mechanosensitive ion channel family protein [Xanthomonadales bacterium]|nr:mechanosensitive ion channel family protein [Xanthomonadales bacterium]
MDTIEQLLGRQILENSGKDWLTALAIAALLMVAFFVIKSILRSRIQTVAAQTATPWDDAVVDTMGKTTNFALVVFALALGSLSLGLPDSVRNVMGSVAMITLTIQAGLWASNLLKFWLQHAIKRRREEDPASVATLSVASWVGRIILWSVVLLLVLDNIGFDITALIAGLGIGGVAVALAIQKILGDLFASLSIVLDKPFVVGDFLIVDDYIGSVEAVGLKTTRLRSLSGEQLVMSNSDLLQSRLRNYGRMFERRILFNIGVTYQTPRKLLEKIPSMIEQAVAGQEKVRFDRSHFKNYGDFSLDFETVYYVTDPDYALYMDIQQAINLKVHEAFENEGIEFAYPTQTVFLEGLEHKQVIDGQKAG